MVVLAAVTAWLVRLPGPADQLTTPIAPVLVTVTPSDGAVQRPVQVRVDIGPALTSFSVLPGGVVTAVLVRPGAVVRTGSRLVEVDGVARLAAHTSRPFYRPLGRGDRGADVDALTSLLGQLGLRPHQARPHVFDAGIASAVRRLAVSIGAASDGTFDPAWVVWLPAPQLVVSAVHAEAGAPVAAAGQPLRDVRRHGRQRRARRRSGRCGASGERRARGTRHQHGAPAAARQCGGARRRWPGGCWARPSPRRRRRRERRTQPTAPSDGHSAAPRSVTIGAVRVTRWRDVVADVPVAGLVTRSDASVCVVVRSGESWRAVPVEVVGSDPATLQAEVRGLTDGARMVANPEAAGLADRCRGAP